MREPARSGCPINMAVEAFGDRWSRLVPRDVMFGNRRHFRELLAARKRMIHDFENVGDSLIRFVTVELLD